MSHYRDLNRELVEQVQVMRKNMKLYSNEIVYLKGELMQKHESEVLLRKQCYNWAVKSFLQLIQSVQPESDILPILIDHVQSEDKMSYTLSPSSRTRAAWRSRTSGERLSDPRRRSTVLTMELQRSNSVITLRKSPCSTSPIRRSSRGDSDEEGNEVEENVANSENELTQTETTPIVLHGNIIYEEEEEQDQSQCPYDVSEYESVEEASLDISQTKSTLKDVTNTLTAITDSFKKENSHSKTGGKRARPKKTKTHIDDQENTNENKNSFELDKDAAVYQNITNRTKHWTRASDNIDIEEETLQEQRRHTNGRYVSETNKSIPISQNINHLHDEVTLSSPTSNFTDMSLGYFKDAPCSTPNSRTNSLVKSKTPIMVNDSAPKMTPPVSSDSTNTSTRPSRQCKPKDLSEPKLGTKLRNDNNDTKPKRRQKSKSKRKK